MEIRYYNGTKLDCVKYFDNSEKEDFIFWLEFEKRVGNTLIRISDHVYKCIFK